MREWSVMIEAESDGGTLDLDLMEDAADRLLEALGRYSPSVTYSPSSYSARMTLKAKTAPDAIGRARTILEQAANKVGLPLWEFTIFQATEGETLAAILSRPNRPELLGLAELARLLSVSKQRASEIAKRPDFPAPAAELASGPVWIATSVERFLREWDRKPGRPKKRAAAGDVG